MKMKIYFVGYIIPMLLICFSGYLRSAEKNDTSRILNYIKQENTSGIAIYGKPEREQLLTKSSVNFEELFTTSAKFRIGKHFWDFQEYKHETLNFRLETGFLAGSGNLRDSTFGREITADHSITGWRTNAAVNYSSRFYYDLKNYTLVEINAWGRFDLYNQKAEGTITDSLKVSMDYAETETIDKLRVGFQAKAGWGFGRLNPVNHLMVAEYLMDKYYQRRVFSSDELKGVAQKIGKIKHQRNPKKERLTKQEIQQLADFLKTKYMLKDPGSIESDWKMGEFLPRFDGTRLELGPFFNYYNREPDFVYGGFVKLEQSEYIDNARNRNFCAVLNYSHYKKKNWLVLETDLGWSFYKNLKSQFDIGFKYVPGTVIHDIDDIEPVSHSFIPYMAYYTQLNSNTRVNLAFAWRIADDEQFMQNGPEFSLAIYRSKY